MAVYAQVMERMTEYTRLASITADQFKFTTTIVIRGVLDADGIEGLKRSLSRWSDKYPKEQGIDLCIEVRDTSFRRRSDGEKIPECRVVANFCLHRTDGMLRRYTRLDEALSEKVGRYVLRRSLALERAK